MILTLLCCNRPSTHLNVIWAQTWQFEGMTTNYSWSSLEIACEKLYLDARKYFFSFCVVTIWNQLPVEIFNVVTVIAFAAKLHSCDLSRYLLYAYSMYICINTIQYNTKCLLQVATYTRTHTHHNTGAENSI